MSLDRTNELNTTYAAYETRQVRKWVESLPETEKAILLDKIEEYSQVTKINNPNAYKLAVRLLKGEEG